MLPGRAKLKELMDIVMAGKSRVILVRDSKPEIALVRYDDVVQKEEMSEKEWVRCRNCDDGFSYHDCGEDTCICLNPVNNVVCDVCLGEGGWEITLSAMSVWDSNG